jgi:hypothetical protein
MEHKKLSIRRRRIRHPCGRRTLVGRFVDRRQFFRRSAPAGRFRKLARIFARSAGAPIVGGPIWVGQLCPSKIVVYLLIVVVPSSTFIDQKPCLATPCRTPPPRHLLRLRRSPQHLLHRPRRFLLRWRVLLTSPWFAGSRLSIGLWRAFRLGRLQPRLPRELRRLPPRFLHRLLLRCSSTLARRASKGGRRGRSCRLHLRKGSNIRCPFGRRISSRTRIPDSSARRGVQCRTIKVRASTSTIRRLLLCRPSRRIISKEPRRQ